MRTLLTKVEERGYLGFFEVSLVSRPIKVIENVPAIWEQCPSRMHSGFIEHCGENKVLDAKEDTKLFVEKMESILFEIKVDSGVEKVDR